MHCKATVTVFLLASGLHAGIHAAEDSGKKLLWGDTHVHSYYSTDSYLNQNFTAGPDTAYRWAKGLPVELPSTGVRVRIDTPLDFLVVADHAESYGTMWTANRVGLPRDDLGPVDWLKSWMMEKLFRLLAGSPDSLPKLMAYAFPDTDDPAEAAKNPASISIPNTGLVIRDTWKESTRITDSHNVPGEFTALIGWEWSSIPGGANLHRVIFTSSDASVATRFSPFSSSTNSYPEDLWKWLEQTASDTGADFVSIPHNSNISRGYMFPVEKRLRDTPIDRQWIDLRARWETVVEATQVKGDSETDPAVSPDDPFADFESYPHYIFPRPIPWNPGAGDFVRSALRSGLSLEQQFGANPYRFGLIGSTDSHTGLASAEEPNFWGKFPTDATLEGKTKRTASIENFGWAMSASGLAAVWTQDNSRESILQAFKRREVYATTGPRIAVRVYAGGDIASADIQTDDLTAIGADAVPMGGELRGLSSAPSFFIQAHKDPRSAHLDRIQMIKGWFAEGKTFEKVYDVVWSGNRQRDERGAVVAITDTVNPATGRYSNEHGAATLSATWTDPDFDPAQPAFYYVRVLEIPTARHSTLDAIALGLAASETGHPVSIQERAYTSPIHYSP
jgi:hypothetical protein